MIARQITIHDDVASTAHAIAARLITSINDAIAARGVAHVVVTGGSLGIAALVAVAENPAKTSVNWSQVHFWWGDERFVASDSADRNVLQAEPLFAALDELGLDRGTVHAMPELHEHPVVFLAIDTPRRAPDDVTFVDPAAGDAASFMARNAAP